MCVCVCVYGCMYICVCMLFVAINRPATEGKPQVSSPKQIVLMVNPSPDFVVYGGSYRDGLSHTLWKHSAVENDQLLIL